MHCPALRMRLSKNCKWFAGACAGRCRRRLVPIHEEESLLRLPAIQNTILLQRRGLHALERIVSIQAPSDALKLFHSIPRAQRIHSSLSRKYPTASIKPPRSSWLSAHWSRTYHRLTRTDLILFWFYESADVWTTLFLPVIRSCHIYCSGCVWLRPKVSSLVVSLNYIQNLGLLPFKLILLCIITWSTELASRKPQQLESGEKQPG